MAYFKHVPDGNKGKIIYNRSIVNGIVLLAISEIEGVEAATVESLKKRPPLLTQKKQPVANLPKKQTQCRSCGRPIGKKYAWQCKNPTYY